MARRTIYVSDLSNRELSENDAVEIKVNFKDARRGVYVIDAHPDDDIVQKLTNAGRRQSRRGRKPQPTPQAA